MPYVAPEVVQRVKQIDLLTYLKTYEPSELVHFSGNVYTTRSHDSLKISNGKWMWWMIIPGLFEPPVRTLRATIPENESHIFR